jgi:hypothetical protein
MVHEKLEKYIPHMKLLVSFKEFAADPVKALLFLMVCAVGYLYIENRMIYTRIIEKQDKDILELKEQVKTMDSTIIQLIRAC